MNTSEVTTYRHYKKYYFYLLIVRLIHTLGNSNSKEWSDTDWR